MIQITDVKNRRLVRNILTWSIELPFSMLLPTTCWEQPPRKVSVKTNPKTDAAPLLPENPRRLRNKNRVRHTSDIQLNNLRVNNILTASDPRLIWARRESWKCSDLKIRGETDTASHTFCMHTFHSRTDPVLHAFQPRLYRDPSRRESQTDGISSWSSHRKLTDRKKVNIRCTLPPVYES